MAALGKEPFPLRLEQPLSGCEAPCEAPAGEPRWASLGQLVQQLSFTF